MQDSLFDAIANDLRQTGLSVVRLKDVSVATDTTECLASRLFKRLMQLQSHQMESAGTGRLQEHQLNERVRRDKIHWLSRQDDAESCWLNFMDEMRVAMNRRLLLGLFSHECHFAHYQPGAFYKRHLDAFKGKSNRMLTTVFYLNPEWHLADGGELVVYESEHSDAVRAVLRPEFGTLVTFLSEEFPHEVLPAKRDRYSIAGWFRINTSMNGVIDPPR